MVGDEDTYMHTQKVRYARIGILNHSESVNRSTRFGKGFEEIYSWDARVRAMHIYSRIIKHLTQERVYWEHDIGVAVVKTSFLLAGYPTKLL